ncbi:MAG: methionyl-tRNA formyltransferase [Rectinema sp.]
MRVLFAGSPDIAVPAMEALAASSHTVTAVLTNPASKVGRGLKMSGTPVAQAALRLWGDGVPIFTFETLKTTAREAVAACNADILVSFAYGHIFGPKFMALFPKGGINVHPSLLPRWRGSSPIQHTILAMDEETGISIQTIAPEMDTGDLLLVQRIPLTGREKAGTLSGLCAHLAAPMVVEALDAIDQGKARPRPQTGDPTYCGKISKEDGRVDWGRPSRELDARIRAFDPWPGSYTSLRNMRLSILEAEPFDEFVPSNADEHVTNSVPGTIIAVAATKGIIIKTGQGYLAVKHLQLATRKSAGFREFANGVRDLVGTVLF